MGAGDGQRESREALKACVWRGFGSVVAYGSRFGTNPKDSMINHKQSLLPFGRKQLLDIFVSYSEVCRIILPVRQLSLPQRNIFKRASTKTWAVRFVPCPLCTVFTLRESLRRYLLRGLADLSRASFIWLSLIRPSNLPYSCLADSLSPAFSPNRQAYCRIIMNESEKY